MSRAVLVGLGSVVLVAAVGLPAAAGSDKDDLETVLAELEVTDEMAAGATYDLAKAATNATYAIDPAGSEFSLEKTETSNDQTSTTLTSDLLFEFGKADLMERARTALGDLAKKIPQGAVVAVDGYTDSVSGDDVNVPLSQDRAQAVADALAAARPDLVLTAAGHGSADPVAPNTNEDGSDNPVGRQFNRRVELTYAAG